MADVKINITSKTAQAKAALDGLDKSLKGVSATMQGAKASAFDYKMAMAGVAAGAAALKVAFDNTAGAAIDYAAQVRDLNRVTGAGTEETSRLIQVADDMTISFGDLEQAARIASKNGIEFTTESLGRLSDQYLALNPGQERAAFLIETFGKNGLEMGKMMELGSAGIEAASAAIGDNLVLTEDAVQAARDFEIAQDNLSDAVLGVKIALGNQLVPVLTKAINAVITLTTAGSTQRDVWKQHERVMRTAAGSYEEYTAEMERSARVAGFNWEAIMALNDGVTDLGSSQDYLIQNWGMMTELQYANIGANEDWMDALDGVQSAASGLGDTLEFELGDSILTASNAMRDLTAELLYNVASQGLDEDAAISLARSMGLLDEGTYAAMNATELLRQKLEDGQITLAQYEAGVLAIGGAWGLVPENVATTYTVTVRGDPIPDFGLTDPDAPIIPGDDDIGPGGGVPGARGAAQGNTYNVVINTAANANAVADRLKILEAYGA